MLWEIWGRHKVNFLWDGAALAASCFFVLWKEHGVSQAIGEMLGCAAFFCFLGGYGQLLVCLGWFEVDDRTVQFSFPGRLLLKPVSTARLVLVPMLFGGAVIVTLFALWAELVWRHVVGFSAYDLLWTSAVLLSFFWWMQALAWSLPLPKARMLAMIVMGMLHFLVWRMPQMQANALSGWQWPILSALLVSAVPVAWIGLKLMRQGSWEGPSRISTLWSRLGLARARSRQKKFRFAFAAQFWLEWRRQGWLLPGISGGMALLIVVVFEAATFMIHKFLGATWQGSDPEMVGLLYMFILPLLILPLVLSNLLAPALATFDRFHLAGVPGFIAVRPMTNGGFVMAKLAMALATSALTWLVTAAAFLCLALVEKEILLSKAGLVTPFGPVALTDRMPAGVAAAGDLDLEKPGGRDWSGFDRTPLDLGGVSLLENDSLGGAVPAGWDRQDLREFQGSIAALADRNFDRVSGGENRRLDCRFCLGVASQCHHGPRDRLDCRRLAGVRPVRGRLRGPCLQRDQPTRPADLGRARRIPDSSAGRSGHCPAGAGVESAPLKRRLNSEG